MLIATLSPPEVRSTEVEHLLRLATDFDGARLRSVRDEQLPELTVIGARHGGRLLGFAAFHRVGPVVTIEYLATVEERRGSGVGTALVREVQRRVPGTVVHAQTDDDAIGFYRSLGFTTREVRNPLWPGVPRYDCRLSPR